MDSLIKDNYFTDYFNISVSFFCFRKLQIFLEKFVSFKMADNLTCCTHAILCVVLAFSYLISKSNTLRNHAIKISTGFFLSDIFTNLFVNNIKKFNLIMVFHHLITIYIINNPSLNTHYVYSMLYFAELSNFPNYITRYLKLTNGSKEILKYFKKIQLYVYSFIRIFIGCYYSYYYRTDFFKFSLTSITQYIVVIFGMYYSYVLLIIIIKNQLNVLVLLFSFLY